MSSVNPNRPSSTDTFSDKEVPVTEVQVTNPYRYKSAGVVNTEVDEKQVQ
jgi:hypothetical protein